MKIHEAQIREIKDGLVDLPQKKSVGSGKTWTQL